MSWLLIMAILGFLLVGLGIMAAFANKQVGWPQVIVAVGVLLIVFVSVLVACGRGP